MIDKVYDHIISELRLSTRTDTIFVITAIVFNLTVLCINSTVSGYAATAAGAVEYSFVPDLLLAVFILMTLAINLIAVLGLLFGLRTRQMLLKGLLAMYRDHDTKEYYSSSLVSNYVIRYILFAGTIAVLALAAIVVPLITRFL